MGVESHNLKHLTNELELNVPASTVWELYRHLGISMLAAQELKNVIQSVDVLKGDGGVGTILKLTFVPGTYSYRSIFKNNLFDKKNLFFSWPFRRSLLLIIFTFYSRLCNAKSCFIIKKKIFPYRKGKKVHYHYSYIYIYTYIFLTPFFNNGFTFIIYENESGNHSYTERFIEIDDEKRVKVAKGLEGGCLAIGCSVQIVRLDIIEKTSGSCIIKSDIAYAVKEEFEANDPKPNIQLLVIAAQIAKRVLETTHDVAA